MNKPSAERIEKAKSLENLKKRYEELSKEREELGKEIERLELQTVERWEPALGQKYWYWCINSSGKVFSERNTDHEFDKKRILLGNCFRTQEEAIKHVERVRMFNLLYQYADVKEPKEDEKVCFPCVSGEEVIAYKDWPTKGNPLPFGFSSPEKVLDAIDAIGRDEFIRIWGGME